MNKFTKDDIDLYIAEKTALLESKKIYKNPKSRYGRTLEKIYESALMGHIAEQYLIQKHNWKNDPNEYKDVFSPSGVSYDVKTTSYEKYIPSVIKGMKKKIAEGKKCSHNLIFFVVKNGEYTFHSIVNL